MLIGERSWFPNMESWIERLVFIQGLLPQYPRTALQVRSVTPTALEDVRQALNRLVPHPQIRPNGLHQSWPYSLHLPERMIDVGHDKNFGCSVHSLPTLAKAIQHGAEYVQFGSIFQTSTKPVLPVGLSRLQHIATTSSIPVLAVGGITDQNAASCLKAGANGISVGTWVLRSPKQDVSSRIERLWSILQS